MIEMIQKSGRGQTGCDVNHGAVLLYCDRRRLANGAAFPAGSFRNYQGTSAVAGSVADRPERKVARPARSGTIKEQVPLLARSQTGQSGKWPGRLVQELSRNKCRCWLGRRPARAESGPAGSFRNYQGTSAVAGSVADRPERKVARPARSGTIKEQVPLLARSQTGQSGKWPGRLGRLAYSPSRSRTT